MGPIDKMASRNRLVLVVDDDEGVRELCVDALNEAGYVVVACARGEDALRLLDAITADVLVVDWNMPGLDGAEVARRARVRDPRLGVVMITGEGRQAAEAARRAGVSRILDKPFVIDDLVGAVATLAAERWPTDASRP